MWRSPTKIPIPWIFKHVSRHVSICKRSLIRWPSSKDTILVYQGGFSTALWGKRLKSASEKCIQRGRWEIQQREEAKEIPSRKRAQMYITAGSDVGAHVQGQARVWRSYRQTPADSQQENLDSPTTRNWILPTIWKQIFRQILRIRIQPRWHLEFNLEISWARSKCPLIFIIFNHIICSL